MRTWQREREKGGKAKEGRKKEKGMDNGDGGDGKRGEKEGGKS